MEIHGMPTEPITDPWDQHLLRMAIESAEDCGDGAGAEELRKVLHGESEDYEDAEEGCW